MSIATSCTPRALPRAALGKLWGSLIQQHIIPSGDPDMSSYILSVVHPVFILKLLPMHSFLKDILAACLQYLRLLTPFPII